MKHDFQGSLVCFVFCGILSGLVIENLFLGLPDEVMQAASLELLKLDRAHDLVADGIVVLVYHDAPVLVGVEFRVHFRLVLRQLLLLQRSKLRHLLVIQLIDQLVLIFRLIQSPDIECDVSSHVRVWWSEIAIALRPLFGFDDLIWDLAIHQSGPLVALRLGKLGERFDLRLLAGGCKLPCAVELALQSEAQLRSSLGPGANDRLPLGFGPCLLTVSGRTGNVTDHFGCRLGIALASSENFVQLHLIDFNVLSKQELI